MADITKRPFCADDYCDSGGGPRGPRGPRGPAGPGNDASLIADEDIPPGSPIAPGGSARLAIANGTDRGNTIGIAITHASAGQPVKYQASGVVDLSPETWDAVTGETGGLVENALYYVSQTTPGKLTTLPSTDGQVFFVGTAASDRQLVTSLYGARISPAGATGPTGPTGPVYNQQAYFQFDPLTAVPLPGSYASLTGWGLLYPPFFFGMDALGRFLQGASNNTTLAAGSHAEGYNTQSAGEYSHVEGLNTFTQGTYAHAEGDGTFALGEGSHAEGANTEASSIASHSSGMASQALRVSQQAYASGVDFTTPSSIPRGFFQTSVLVLRGSTPGSAPNESVELVFGFVSPDNEAQHLNLENGKSYAFKVTAVCAGAPDGFASRTIEIAFNVYQTGDAITITGSPDPVSYGTENSELWSLEASVEAEPTRVALTFSTGDIQAPVNVAAKVEFTEVTRHLPRSYRSRSPR